MGPCSRCYVFRLRYVARTEFDAFSMGLDPYRTCGRKGHQPSGPFQPYSTSWSAIRSGGDSESILFVTTSNLFSYRVRMNDSCSVDERCNNEFHLIKAHDLVASVAVVVPASLRTDAPQEEECCHIPNSR